MSTSRWAQAQDLSVAAFRRLTGVDRGTFESMCAVVAERATTKKKAGRPSALAVEDQVLLTLEFWREYRTHFHQAQSWGIHEATAWRIVRRVEDALITAGRFALPGRRGVQAAQGTVAVDVTEPPVERPKKDSAPFTVARRR